MTREETDLKCTNPRRKKEQCGRLEKRNKKRIPVTTSDLRAENHCEVGLAMVANGVGWAANVDLVRLGPAHAWLAIPRETDLTFASTVCGPCTDPDVSVATLHDGKVVRRTFLAGVSGMTEFKESLCTPLLGHIPLTMSGEAHSRGVKWSGHGDGLALDNISGRAHLDHFERGGDLGEDDRLRELALVADVEVESIVARYSGGVVGFRDGICGHCCCERQERYKAYRVHDRTG